jgi:hypothetical protein
MSKILPDDFRWFPMCSEGDHEHLITTDRMRFDNGWLVRVVAVVKGSVPSVALSYIPDASHGARHK